MNAKYENPDSEDRPPKVNPLERNVRQKAIEDKVKGVPWSNKTRVGGNFLNKANAMYETGTLRHLHWEEHTTERMERKGKKVDPVCKPDASGVVKEFSFQNSALADFGTGLLLQENLRLRSVCFHLALICSCEKMQEWSEKLMAAFSKDVIPGRCPVTIAQLHLADRE